jgi:hypothetical protein
VPIGKANTRGEFASAGDVVLASIEKIGTMEVQVRAASDLSEIGHA